MRINAQDDESGMACLVGDWVALVVSDGLLDVGLVTQIDVTVVVAVVMAAAVTATVPASVMMGEWRTFNHWGGSVICTAMMSPADVSEV